MKQKKLLLMFFISIAFFVGIKNVSSLEYKLIKKSNNPITCEYESKNNDTIKLVITYKNGKFSVVSKTETVDENGNNSEIEVEENGVNVKFNSMSSKNSCPEKIEAIFDSSYKFVEVVPTYNKVHCGSGTGKFTGIPKKIPELTSLVITIIQIAIPVILVLMGSIDLFKGITASKDDEIKKGQQMFIKRLVLGAIIFFVVVIVKFFISIVADTNVSNIVSCIDCFVDNDCLEGYE